MKKPLHLFLDGDLIAFRTAAGNQKKDKLTGEITTTPDKAREDLQRFVDWMRHKFGQDVLMTAVFSGSFNFRKAIYHPYKSNRDPTNRPCLLADLRDLLAQKTGRVHVVEGLEADDLLGYHLTEPQEDEERILVSYDKDMRTIPGITIYDSLADQLIETTSASAEAAFLGQVMTGDTTDGYAGIPMVGPKTVEKLLPAIMELPTREERWQAVVKLFAQYHLPESYALLMARCARILQHEDIDLDLGAIRLFDGAAGQWVLLDELQGALAA